MKTFILQSLASMGTGIIVGLLFAWIRLPVPAPPSISAVFGILGITVGYLLFKHFFG
jgi:XapX domain-containing protein